MATMIRGVEKDFLLKSFSDEQIPIICHYNREEYRLKIEQLGKSEIVFKTNRIITGLISEKKIDFSVDYKSVVIVFVVEINKVKDDQITTTIPEALYKNQERSYSRVEFPLDMQLRFSFLEERYLIPFSGCKLPEDQQDHLQNTDFKDFHDIVTKMDSQIKSYADAYKLVLFKNTKPVSLEEQIIAKTGKTLFLPSVKNGLLETDPGSKKRVITKEIFKDYLAGIGVLPVYFDTALEQFLHSKQVNKVCSDAWIPLIFKEYIIGYIHIWITDVQKPALEYQAIEDICQYANTLVFFLNEKQYFDAFSIKDKFIIAKGVDISAGGLRFVYPESYISSYLVPDTEILIKLITSKRTINVHTKVIRKYNAESSTFFGCYFLDLLPEDIRFLYEYIYGRPFVDTENVS